MGVKSLFPIFSGKISVRLLSPLYRPKKPPYLRGDTAGGGGLYLGGVK